jgi:hypothetical protein
MTSRKRNRVKLPNGIFVYRTKRKLFAWHAVRSGAVVAVAGEDYTHKKTCYRAARRNGPPDLQIRDWVDVKA